MTLVVPVRNEESHIGACLRAIGAQTYPHDRLDVIVVDGQSDDRTVAATKDVAAGEISVRILTNPHRSMPTGLNLGIREATGEFVGVVSGHSILPPDYVAIAVDTAQRTDAWSVGGQIVRRATTPMQRAIARATSSRLGVGDSAHNYATQPGWVETVFPGFWRRELFGRIGLFDPAMTANEDNELSFRIRKAGGGIWFEPSIRVEYVPRSSLSALFRQYRLYGLGKMRVLRKHGGGLRARHFVPAAWVAFLALGAVIGALQPSTLPIWATVVAVYLLLVLVASARLADGLASWWLIAAAIVTLHAAYGIGTWQGVATWTATGTS